MSDVAFAVRQFCCARVCVCARMCARVYVCVCACVFVCACACVLYIGVQEARLAMVRYLCEHAGADVNVYDQGSYIWVVRVCVCVCVCVCGYGFLQHLICAFLLHVD